MGIVALLAACSNPSAPAGNYGAISGRITATSGQPIAGATITVDSGPSATSDSSGNYTVQYVPVTDPLSPAVVVVQANGYVSQTNGNVQVKTGSTTPNVNFTLSPG